MNIEIIADNRTVRIMDCHSGAEECSGIALELWTETAPVNEEVGAGTSISTEIQVPTGFGFKDVSSGEQLEVK